MPLFLRRISVSSAVGTKNCGVMSASTLSVGLEDSKQLRHSHSERGESSSHESYNPSSNISSPFANLILSSRSRFNLGGKKTESAGSSSGNPENSSKNRKGKEKKKGNAKSPVNGASAPLNADTPRLDV